MTTVTPEQVFELASALGIEQQGREVALAWELARAPLPDGWTQDLPSESSSVVYRGPAG
jgi:hypothetical protein